MLVVNGHSGASVASTGRRDNMKLSCNDNLENGRKFHRKKKKGNGYPSIIIRITFHYRFLLHPPNSSSANSLAKPIFNNPLRESDLKSRDWFPGTDPLAATCQPIINSRCLFIGVVLLRVYTGESHTKTKISSFTRL